MTKIKINSTKCNSVDGKMSDNASNLRTFQQNVLLLMGTLTIMPQFVGIFISFMINSIK
jgi:hypothetical protein